MTVLYFLIPLALILVAFAIWAFFWAVRDDQFEDLETPAMRILFEDPPRTPSSDAPGPKNPAPK